MKKTIALLLTIVFATTRSEGVGLAVDAIGSLIMMGMAIVSFLYVIIFIKLLILLFSFYPS